MSHGCHITWSCSDQGPVVPGEFGWEWSQCEKQELKSRGLTLASHRFMGPPARARPPQSPRGPSTEIWAPCGQSLHRAGRPRSRGRRGRESVWSGEPEHHKTPKPVLATAPGSGRGQHSFHWMLYMTNRKHTGTPFAFRQVS